MLEAERQQPQKLTRGCTTAVSGSLMSVKSVLRRDQKTNPKWRDDLRVVPSFRREAPSARSMRIPARYQKGPVRRTRGRRRSIALQKIDGRCDADVHIRRLDRSSG